MNDTKPDAVEAARETLRELLTARAGAGPLLTSWERDAIDTVLAALAQREQAIQTLREWMAQYPDDKYTGRWWAGELDRLLRVAPPRPEEDRK
jgi:hypothetical protein